MEDLEDYPLHHINEGLRIIDPNLIILSDINRCLKGSYTIKEHPLYDQYGCQLTSGINLLIDYTIIAKIAISSSLSTSLGVKESHRIYEELIRYLNKRKKVLYDQGLSETFFSKLYSDE